MRLAAQAKMGYYPTPQPVISLIADILVRNAKGSIKLLDPCAGVSSIDAVLMCALNQFN